MRMGGAIFAVVRCLSVCPSRWWIVPKRLKLSSYFLFGPVAQSLYFIGPMRRYPIPRWTPSAGAQNTRGWEKFAIFNWNRRLSRKRNEIGPWLLWNVNMKSEVASRYVSVPMTLNDLKPRFQDHGIIWQWTSQKRHEIETYWTSAGSHMRSVEWWHFRWPWRTPNPVFKITAFLKSIISKHCVLSTKFL